MKTTNCPSCGAAINFQSAASILTVCTYCRSTLIRHDLDLENVGRMAELLPDPSPIQLGTTGVYRKSHFTVVGRIQLRYSQGLWNEWYLLFDNQRGGWLGETLGQYALTFNITPPEPLPALAELRAGDAVTLKGRVFQVTNIESTRCIGGEGELPIRVGPGYDAALVDLQASGNAFATLDYSETPPLVFMGEPVRFDDLRLEQLRPVPPVGWEPDAGLDARAFQCPNCASSLTIRAPGRSESLACGTCGAVIDLSDDNFRILSTFQSRVTHEPLIALGAHGTLSGIDYQAIGYLRRCVSVEGVDYEWSEYLLFHREQGFCWLVEYNGHWSQVRTLSDLPEVSGLGAKAEARYQEHRYRHFQTAQARVSYVLGEFYWRVAVGESVEVSDYIAPPLQLSCERSEREIVWSLGSYIEAQTVQTAFQLSGPLPPRVGIAASQPSPYEAQRPKLRRLRGLFLGLLLIAQVLTLLLCADQRVHQQTFTFDASTQDKLLSSAPFALSGRPSNVLIQVQTNLDNNWLYLDMALIEQQSGARYAVSREIDYYQGIDEGERWSEGSARDEALLTTVPAGLYYLTIESERAAAAPPVTATFSIWRDVPSWSNFFLALLGLLLLPAWFWWRASAFERARWAESDYGAAGSSGSSRKDDDD